MKDATILTMIIPHRNPWELLVGRQEVEIGAILQTHVNSCSLTQTSGSKVPVQNEFGNHGA